jgi:hypothetical protein
MLHPEEASTGLEDALNRKAPTDGHEACATEREAGDGCSMASDEAEAGKKAGLSEVQDQGGDATVVADLMTDEEQDEDDADADCPFDQVDHVDGKMMKEEEDEDEDDDDDDVDFPSNAFYAEWKARHGAQFLHQGADVTVVADELTDEEDDDFSSPFDYAFLAKLEERHEEEFQELLAEMMI